MFVGTKGRLLTDGFGPPRWLGAAPAGFQPPAPFLPRVPGGHKADWLDAIRTSGRAACGFDAYGGLLAKVVLSGNVAIRSGKRVEGDAANLKIPNAPDAATERTTKAAAMIGINDLNAGSRPQSKSSQCRLWPVPTV